MLSSVLNSGRAVQVNIATMRTFVRWRRTIWSTGAAGPGFVLQRVLDKDAEMARPRRMAEFSQYRGFDLADALASKGEILAHFPERVLTAII